jgi:hypothetical protein
MRTYDWLSQNAKWKLFWSRIWESIIVFSHNSLHTYLQTSTGTPKGVAVGLQRPKGKIEKCIDFVDKKKSKVLNDLCFSHY